MPSSYRSTANNSKSAPTMSAGSSLQARKYDSSGTESPNDSKCLSAEIKDEIFCGFMCSPHDDVITATVHDDLGC